MSAEIIRFENSQELAAEAARRWINLLQARNPVDSTFTVALSGGRITRNFFEQLVARTNSGAFSGVHFFWADERCVSPNDPESNFALARAHLLEPLRIAADQIHRLRGEADPVFAVAEAEAEICRVAELRDDGTPVIDLVFLGMGEDGHVASLFPGASDEIVTARSLFLHITNSPKPPPERLTLSYAAIGAAREVWVLASGSGKEGAYRNSTSASPNTPLGRVISSRRKTRIFTDIQT